MFTGLVTLQQHTNTASSIVFFPPKVSLHGIVAPRGRGSEWHPPFPPLPPPPVPLRLLTGGRKWRPGAIAPPLLPPLDTALPTTSTVPVTVMLPCHLRHAYFSRCKRRKDTKLKALLAELANDE